jgi:sarcosine oxidase subunit gamma
MPEAARRSALDGLAPPHNSAVAGTVCPPARRWIFRGGRKAAEAAAGVFGVAPPLQPLRGASVGARSALWLGPDEWLLLAEDDEPGLGARLAAGLAGTPHGLVDVSHRQGAIELAGRGAARLLNAGVALDLDPAAFPVGMAARSLLEKAEILLWRRAPELFRVEFARSLAGYVVAILAQAAQDQELC